MSEDAKAVYFIPRELCATGWSLPEVPGHEQDIVLGHLAKLIQLVPASSEIRRIALAGGYTHVKCVVELYGGHS